MKGAHRMKPNRFKQHMAEENFSVGHMISEFGTRGQAKMLEIADIDFVIIDREHTGSTSADIADLVAWFKATDIAPFVRIPQIQYHFIARTLDVGALGLMVPNVKTGDEARAIVDAAKYAPMGDRGVSLGAAHSDYGKVDPRAFMDYANENTTVICQIESREGVENLNDIAGVAGVDVLWVGHFDLSQSMGIPGQFDNPKFLDALKRVIDTARKNSLGIGIQPGSLDQAREWMEMGFNVISYSADHSVYINAMKQAVAGVRNLF
jgi:2-keto-3-deoxy-L-rhamnonate aldolase RhmA